MSMAKPSGGESHRDVLSLIHRRIEVGSPQPALHEKAVGLDQRAQLEDAIVDINELVGPTELQVLDPHVGNHAGAGGVTLAAEGQRPANGSVAVVFDGSVSEPQPAPPLALVREAPLREFLVRHPQILLEIDVRAASRRIQTD